MSSWDDTWISAPWISYPKVHAMPPRSKSDGMGQSAFIEKMETALCTPSWLPSEFHQLLSTWISPTSRIPGLLAQCCPPALPSREAQFYCKFCTYKSNLSSLERKTKTSQDVSLEPWASEVSHLTFERFSNLNTLTCHPPNPLDFRNKPVSLQLLPEVTSCPPLVATLELPYRSLSFLN